MQVIHSVAEMRAFVGDGRRRGATLGFVPTMGALHQGHLSLIRRARQECDATVVSIFLNPAQFGPSEDLARYPQNLASDLELLRSPQVDAVFVPTVNEIYPAGFAMMVDPGPAAHCLEGLARPSHFRGVATVVLKLFNIVSPGVAYFGQKDFQQTVVLRQLIRDFNMDVRLVICPIVRDADGVAVSSRNIYLQPAERKSATLLNRSLTRAKEMFWGGETDAQTVIHEMEHLLGSDSQVRVDYVAIVDRESLNPAEHITAGAVALVAARVGSARVIDNAIFGPSGATEEQLLDLALPRATMPQYCPLT
jgi:pantoate--beta-alanine ligase